MYANTTAVEESVYNLNRAIYFLEQAYSYSKDDIFIGGEITSKEKHKYIRKANKHLTTCHNYMKKVGIDLGVKLPNEHISLDINNVVKDIDIWFDNIFVDVYVHTKIRLMLKELKQLRTKLIALEKLNWEKINGNSI